MSSCSTFKGVVAVFGTSPRRWLTLNTCVSTAKALFPNQTACITLAVFLPTPGSFVN